MKLKNLLPGFAMIALTQTAPLTAADLKVGDAFPEIVLPRIDDGEAQSLVQFRGQRLMLHIFASW